MSEHTRGPWKWLHNSASTSECYCLEIRGGERIGNVAYCQSYKTDDYDDRDETLANARLISAAPELLEAIEDMAAEASYKAGLGVSEWRSFLTDKARAAIAKATGEQA